MRINLTPELLEGLNMMKEASGMSFQTISEKTGIEKSTVSRYLSGKLKSIPHDKLLQILNVIGTAEEVQNIVEQYGVQVETEDDHPRAVRDMDEMKSEIERLNLEALQLKAVLDEEKSKNKFNTTIIICLVITVAALLVKIFIH
jgi:transcriptional regulator with XRE-family HTH domain